MSSRDMTINQIKAVDKDFGNKHTISVKGFKDNGNGRITLMSINDKLDSFIIEQREMWRKQIEFNKSMLEFKDYVLDVFKRNNLK